MMITLNRCFEERLLRRERPDIENAKLFLQACKNIIKQEIENKLKKESKK